MAKLFIGIAAAFMLATAVVSFMLKGKVDALQSDRKSANLRISGAEGQAKNAKKEADDAKKEAKDADDKLQAANQQAADAKKAADDAKKQVDEINLVLEKTKKDLETAMAGGKKPDLPDPQIAELQAKVQDLTAKADAAAKDVAEKQAVIDSQASKVKAEDEKLAKLEKLERERALKVGLSGLRARILAVNAGWNFVVLDKGDKAGVTLDDP